MPKRLLLSTIPVIIAAVLLIVIAIAVRNSSKDEIRDEQPDGQRGRSAAEPGQNRRTNAPSSHRAAAGQRPGECGSGGAASA